MSMKYTNIKIPAKTALLTTDEDIYTLLVVLVGDVDDVFDASTGSSPFGPYDEGDIVYENGDGTFTLSYDYMLLDDDTARIFRYVVTAA